MQLHHIQPAALQVLLTVKETHSFSEAAKTLGVTQSAVSQTIDRLEALYGLTIFDRSTRPLRLTQTGVELCALAKRLIDEASFFSDALERLKDNAVTGLRFGITEVIGTYAGSDIQSMLIKKLSTFHAQSGLIPKILESFAAGNLDVVVAPNIPQEHRLIASALLEESYMVVAPKWTGLQEDNLPLPLLRERLSGPFLSYHVESMDWRQSQSILRTLMLPAGRSLALENTQAVVQAVIGKLGWTILPPTSLWLVRDQLDEVSVHGLADISMKKTHWVATRDLRFKPFVEDIATLFRESFTQQYLPKMLKKKPELKPYVKLLEDCS